MLISKFRNGLKSKFTQYLLVIMCLSLVFGVGFFRRVQYWITGRNGTEIVIVNKECIDRREFIVKKQEFEAQIALLYRQFGAYTPFLLEQQGINPDPEKAALNMLIQEKLIDQAVNSFPLAVDGAFIQNKIYDPIFMYQNFPSLVPHQFVKENKIDTDGYQSYIQSIDKQELIQKMVKLLPQQLMMELVGQSAYVPQFFMDSLLKLQTQEKQYDIYSIYIDDLKKEVSKKEVTSQELQKFYDQENKKNGRYTIAPKRSGILWTFDPKDFSINISDKELEDHYNKVKQSQFIAKPTEVQIREIVLDQVKEKGLKQLYKEAQDIETLLQQNPENFEKYVKEYSTGKSAARGGLSEFFKRGTKEKALEQAAFRLKKDGEISPIIELENGYAIIQRVARKEAEYKPFNNVKQEIYTTLQQRKFANQFSLQANKVIRSRSDNAQEEYTNFLKQFKAKESAIDPIEKQDQGFGSRLFALKKQGDKVAFVADGKGYILVLKDILKKSDIPFSLIQDTVKQDYHTAHAHKLLGQRLENLKSEVQSGKKPSDTVVKKTTTGWFKNEKDEAFITLQKDGISPEVLGAEKVGSIVSAATDKKGYVAVLVDTRDASGNAPEIDKAKQANTRAITGFAQQGFIASLYKNATIEVLLEQAANNPGDAYDFQI